MGPKPKFQDGEKVLCFHGPLLYEAKCVKSETRERAMHYFVHYNGWNKSWDEWVPETRILKLNDAGLQKQQECLKALKAEKAKNREKAKEAKEAALAAGVTGKKDKKKESKDRSATPTVDAAKPKHKEEKSTPATSGKSKRERGDPRDRTVLHTETPVAAEQKDQKSERSSRASTPTPGATSSKRSKDSTVEKDRSSRSSTPTIAQQAKRQKDTTVEKDRSSRSSTPTIAQQAKRQKVERAAASAAASQISRQSSQGAGDQPSQPSQSVPSSQESTATTATSVSTPATPASQASTDQKRKRARLDQTVEAEESYLTKIEVRVKVPDELKPWLVDDWDLVTRQYRLVSLPCKHTVNSILDDYLALKLTKPNHPDKDTIIEVNNGIREYFNVMLGTQLLFKFERPQYAQVLADNEGKEMSSVYGATHLLRLFVKLGSMLAFTKLDEKSIQVLLHHIHDFLKYMQRNASTLFTLSDYYIAPPEYHRKAL